MQQQLRLRCCGVAKTTNEAALAFAVLNTTKNCSRFARARDFSHAHAKGTVSCFTARRTVCSLAHRDSSHHMSKYMHDGKADSHVCYCCSTVRSFQAFAHTLSVLHPFHGMSSSADARQRQIDWRTGRERAVRELNSIASKLGVPETTCRPSSHDMVKLWEGVCAAAGPEHHEALEAARATWLEHHGGGDLQQALLHVDGSDDSSDLLENHRTLTEARALGNAGKKTGFRLQSKAFLLTFNSSSFDAGDALWEEFLAWVRNQAATYGATEWSAALERSLSSSTPGRVHFHVYFSWSKPKAQGVDHRTTDKWVFKGSRPRVDVNTERRGPAYWIRATQRGHFYCSVHKSGAVRSATNYPPWEGVWVPDVSWVLSLYRQHKLDHDMYLSLSAKLRDGHDRRKASVEAVRASEAAKMFEEEKAWARCQLAAKAKPFKPLCPLLEAWIMSYEELEERYRMLVLHGPSRTGKSRLARSLFGTERTLVVDVQHAAHPDLHGYRRHHHRAILLDEVANPSFIVGNKKLLQAHVDGALLGQSATQMFTYEVFLWRTPIILTTNNWDLRDLSEDELEWVHANCVVVYVPEPVYADAASSVPPPQVVHQRRDQQGQIGQHPPPPQPLERAQSQPPQLPPGPPPQLLQQSAKRVLKRPAAPAFAHQQAPKRKARG